MTSVVGRLRDAITHHRAAALILGLYLILATAYNLADPLFEPPDELLHYDFIRFVQRERRLPVVDVSAPPTEYHQPPLYYIVTALVTAPLPQGELEPHTLVNPFWGYEIGKMGRDNKNQFLHGPAQRFPFDSLTWSVHLTRALSTLFGCGTVLLAYLMARRLVSEPLAVASMAVVAFTPNFLLTSGAVTNDSLLVLLSVAGGVSLLSLVAREAAPPPVAWVGLAALLGLAMLTKLSAWPLLPLAALGVTLLAGRLRSWRLFVTAGALLMSGVALLGGWWVLRNLRLYGDLTGLSSMWAVWGVREPLGGADYLIELRNFHTTFWANFGYGNVPAPGWAYVLTGIFTIGGMAGLLKLAFRVRELSLERRDQVIVLVGWAVITLLALIWYLQRTFSVTGRQLYPVLPVIALGLVGGWAAFFPPEWHSRMAGVIVGLMVAFALGAWAGVLIPAYRPAPRLTEEQATQAIAHRLDWQLGDVVTLLGYSVLPSSVNPGEEVEVTLYWQPLRTPEQNYTVFVQLFGEENRRVGARDTYPGLGNDPTIYWRPGEIIADSIPVPISPDAQGPILLDIVAGLYDLETGERLPVHDPDGNVIEHPLIGTVRLAGRPEDAALPAYESGAVFEGELRLEGYDLSTTMLEAGSTLLLTLYWAPGGPLDAAYTVFVHLVDESGEIIAQGDAPPRGGRYPSTVWEAGDRFPDPHLITLPPDLPPGEYYLLVGLYDPQNNTRLPLAGGEDHVRLGRAIHVR
ncbi:MAG TPA: phospholipid carrier-dependent glycosyltransferase [Chloroflexi bacterium]|nr:phospholipid carrier-dependent glycosyltransferase [Chloroflexota bacterium]